MNLLHASWSIGATLAPSLAAAIGLEPDSLPIIYGVAAAISAATGLFPLLFGGTPPASRHANVHDRNSACHYRNQAVESDSLRPIFCRVSASAGRLA